MSEVEQIDGSPCVSRQSDVTSSSRIQDLELVSPSDSMCTLDNIVGTAHVFHSVSIPLFLSALGSEHNHLEARIGRSWLQRHQKRSDA